MTSIIVFVHLPMITTMMVVDILLSVLKKKTDSSTSVKGISEYMLDEIQKKCLSYNNMISPPYFPKSDSVGS